MITIDKEECKRWRSQQSCGLGGQAHIPPADTFAVQGRNEEGVIIRSTLCSAFDWPYYVLIDGTKWHFARQLYAGASQYHLDTVSAKGVEESK
jgi:hypothetical protein